MNTAVEYLIVFMIVAACFYYVWTKIIFKKSAGCSGCKKCK